MQIKRTDIFSKWFEHLKDRRAKAIIAQRIIRVADGLFGDFKSVGNGISEIRINYGPGYRVYCTIRGNELIILLCGGDKSSQKEDIAYAKRIVEEF